MISHIGIYMMGQSGTPQDSVKPSHSVIGVAVALFLGSLLVLLVSLWELISVIQHSYNWNQFVLSISTFVNAVFFGLNLLQIAFSVTGIIVSIGLLRLREWARIGAIFLSTASLATLAFSLLIFVGATSETGRGGMAAGYGVLLFGVVFLLLSPFSIWWFVLLTREGVKSQFSRD